MIRHVVVILLLLCTGGTLTAAADGARPEYFPMPAGPAGSLPFSEAVRVGDMLYLSGQIGLRSETRDVVPGGIAAETRQTLENIRAVLERHGSSLDRVVKCTVFMADMAEWPAMNEVYRTFFTAHLPARSALGASGLALGARVEIECLAVVGAPGSRAADEASLRALHETILEAHRAGAVDPWMAIETPDYVVANHGRLTSPTLAERRAARSSYLAATRFSVYRDRRAPIVTISDDGTRGWLLAEVEIRGVRTEAGGAAGGEATVAADYAWVELYEKRDGRWRLVGNVSNQGP
jgi:reactive intermediate/imine deaminase